MTSPVLDSAMRDTRVSYFYDYIPVSVLGSQPALEWCQRGVECLKNNQTIVIQQVQNNILVSPLLIIAVLGVLAILGFGVLRWYIEKSDNDFINS